tara:strand:- start:909 stop:1064 length:156 start_codon:yes stop_codon:yes gene_type:complete
MNNPNEPDSTERLVIVVVNDKEYEFFGDALTTPLHDAIVFLQELQQKEMVV